MSEATDHVARILESKKRMKKNSEMLQLVNGYFKMTAYMIDFLTALVPSLKEAHHFVELTIKSSHAANENDQPLKILDEFRQYFSVGRSSEFESVCQELLPMLMKLQNQKVEQERKFKPVKIWRKVIRIISVSVFAAFLFSAFVVALKTSSRVVAVMAIASSILLVIMGKLFLFGLKKYHHTLKAEMKLISIMHDWTYIVGAHLDSIRISLKRMEDNRISVLDYAEFVFKDEDPVRLGTEEMRKKMGEFMDSIVDLMQQAGLYSDVIWSARSAVSEEIDQLPA